MKHSSKKEIGKTILVVVAHPDDEVLGCGASIAKWTASGNIVHILIMAEGATSRSSIRDREVKSEELSLLETSANSAGKILGVASVKLLDFPDNRMDSLDRLDIIKAIEEEIKRLNEKFNLLKNLNFGKKERFNHTDISWNYRLTNMQATLGLSQFKRIKQIVKKKREIGNFYFNKFKNG